MLMKLFKFFDLDILTDDFRFGTLLIKRKKIKFKKTKRSALESK